MAHPHFATRPRLSPLFTTSPLEHPSRSQREENAKIAATLAFTTSPISTYDRQYFSDSTTAPMSETLAFAKVPVAPSIASFAGSGSTDSEAPYTSEGCYSPTRLEPGYHRSAVPSTNVNAHYVPRSPSLLSCLFQSNSLPASATASANSSRNNSTSCSSQPTPVTPLSTSPAYTSQNCKPILRRPTASEQCTSTSTSASEDNGYFSQRGGLGLTRLSTDSIDVGPGVGHGASGLGIGVKRGCSLTFAVQPCQVEAALTLHQQQQLQQQQQQQRQRHHARSASSSTCTSSRTRSRARSPPPSEVIHEWEEDPHLLTPDLPDEESDDEGYEEDEEGGFTSDEDELGAFAAQSRPQGGQGQGRVSWNPRFNHDQFSSTWRSRGGRAGIEHYCTTDDNAPEPIRGRKISIAARTTDKCSRHLSPPPRSPSPEYAPPAARSPSARDLCKRRENARASCGDTSTGTGRGNGNGNGMGVGRSASVTARGWRSDGAFAPSARIGVCGGGGGGFAPGSRKASLPDGGIPDDQRVGTSVSCRSILRCTDTEGASTLTSTSTSGMGERRSSGQNEKVTMAGSLPTANTNANANTSTTASGRRYSRPSLRSPSPSLAQLQLCRIDDSCATTGSSSCGDATRGLEAVLRRGSRE